MLLASLAAGRTRLTTTTTTNLSIKNLLTRQPKRCYFQLKINNAAKPNKLFSQQRNLLVSLKLIRMHGVGGGTSMSRKSPMKGAEIIRKLIEFVWPKNAAGVKIRVVIALSLLIGSKLVNVAVPFLFKEIVDFLNKNTPIKDFASTTSEKIVLAMIVLALGYGAARAGASLFGELRNAIFARVAQGSVTQLATQV